MSRFETESINVGAHELHYTPPDVIRCVLRGVVDQTEAQDIIQFVNTKAESIGGKIYSIYDMSEFERVTEAVRKIAIHVDKPYPYIAVAVIGSSFTTRIFSDMIMRAGKLVSPKYFGFSHKFVASVDEANAWFDKLRAEKTRI